LYDLGHYVHPWCQLYGTGKLNFTGNMKKNLNKSPKDLQKRKITVEEPAVRGEGSDDTNLGFAVLDHDRKNRVGTPEVVFAAGKTPGQTLEIVHAILARHSFALVTRCTAEHVAVLVKLEAKWPVVVGKRCGTVLIGVPEPVAKAKAGKELPTIAIVTAGTSDEPVAEEAMLTCLALGQATVRINDVGVAGLHRLIARLEELRKARVIIAIAGMEGALPSVLAGLVKCPLIAVPTSVGYGANLGGITALLAMLSGCAPGITVVNIDNGFGAAVAACRIMGAVEGR
jgi:pyridinium-3,5-biscarboxylic acid mononucleotide synthase